MNIPSDIHVSGSAYKIAKDRAYHHGTMLISSRLSTLGDVLHVSKVRLICHATLVWTLDIVPRWCLGVYDHSRRRVSSLASEEFAGIQSICNSWRFRGSRCSSLPRGVPHRGASTLYVIKSFPSAQHAFFCLGALRAGRGCHGHTIRSRQHGRTPCKCLHLSFMGPVAGSSISRSGIGRLGRLPSSHTQLAGVSDGATWSVKSINKLACASCLDGIVDGGNTLKARCHSIVHVDREGHTRFGVAGKVEWQVGGPKVWVPRGSDGVRRLWENARSAAMVDRGDGQLSLELR